MTHKNGSAQFDFRKASYRDEAQMSILRVKMNHIEKRIAACDADGDIDALLEELKVIEEKVLTSMIKIVTYLPEDYIKEGVIEDDIDYSDPSAVIDVIRFGAMDRLGQDIGEARRTNKKK
jgi:hypothetical protein